MEAHLENRVVKIQLSQWLKVENSRRPHEVAPFVQKKDEVLIDHLEQIQR